MSPRVKSALRRLRWGHITWILAVFLAAVWAVW